ncbi:aminotransferase-like domain-containing protein [Aestuariimicrobium sp. T2.26MG-19.2B]|uniref:aminotransferase-like domain-containing protein n=1 Tax=Aestuariimicrobium sp. T2.26MG-19.2B TaxID=3040679 RepID=UPI00247779A8|nr:PLP-dependent aminotransferase family protein [Aestuariimicrobium sp. T2.26MG-19.2B]CAI9401841.1 Histidinol-phosphate aminotransferase [Aestuariimicrobium sp. T2.26MG-19.2B]
MRTTREVSLPLVLDRTDVEPLPAQLARQLRQLLGQGVLVPGDPLPSTRSLAAQIGTSRGTVVAAYEQLMAEGYVSAAAGSATVVNPQLRRVRPSLAAGRRQGQEPAPPALDLTPGRPWPGEVVGRAWTSAWRQASTAPVLASVPALGLPELRQAWSEHLRRMRAVVRDPGHVVVTGGGREGLALLLLSLGALNLGSLKPGSQSPGSSGSASPAAGSSTTGPRSGRPLRVSVEEPGYPSLRRVPARLGAELVGLPVDENGVVTTDLPTGTAAPDVLVVTPSHQYPLGGSLPIDRRQRLLDWARAEQVVVVEDDYDSELRYTSEPLPALASLDDPDDGTVVLLSTLSKTLTPTLALGFLALPTRLLEPVLEARLDLGQPVSLVTQRALANYLTSGALRQHTQRMRRRYRSRRTQVVAALSKLPGVTVYPMDGGLHAVVETARPEAEVVAQLVQAGVKVSPLSEYWSGGGNRSGLVFGFGALDEDELTRALTEIARAASSR